MFTHMVFLSSRSWLAALTAEVPPDCSLVGFDISTTHSPPEKLSPYSVSFQELDALWPIPEIYHSSFDIMYIRAFPGIINGETLSRLLDTVMAMLSASSIATQKKDASNTCAYGETSQMLISTRARRLPAMGRN